MSAARETMRLCMDPGLYSNSTAACNQYLRQLRRFVWASRCPWLRFLYQLSPLRGRVGQFTRGVVNKKLGIFFIFPHA